MTSSKSDMKRGPDFRIPADERQKYGIMPPDHGSDRVCPKTDTDSCPSGHTMVPCIPEGSGYFCAQCSETMFQPNENWISDKCRLRRSCSKQNMRYADVGSTVRDAMCACMEGYHFNSEDQRLCVQNEDCPKGTVPALYGSTCEACLPKGMYSDTTGRIKECKPLTNCEQLNRCTIVRSNGEADNVCGKEVKDLNNCEELHPTSSSASISTTFTITIVAGVAILFILILIVLIFFLRRQRLRRLMNQRVLSEMEMQQLHQKIIKETDRSPEFCKKVLSTSCSFIEERIDRQIWGLAQELFRTSRKQGHFEQIVSKYKDSQARYTVCGYLQEWKLLKGETRDSVTELFRCLRHIKRDDIVNEICMCMRDDSEYHKQCQDSHSSCNRATLKDECVYAFFPCCYQKRDNTSSVPDAVVVESDADASEAGAKLLAIASDDLDHDEGVNTGGVGGVLTPCSYCSTHPSPSAPELEDVSNGFPSMENVKYSRQFSQPVQATS